MHRLRLFAGLGVLAALWGLLFSAISSTDYASHLDRGLHDLHCSFVPGATPSEGGEGCRVALNSPYAALFKEQIWGGIPISLFGIGCFAFLAGFAAWVAVQGDRTRRSMGALYCALACSPLLVSAALFAISWFELGTICKTCAGIYTGSFLLAVSGVGVLTSSFGNTRPLSWSSATALAATLAGLLVWTLAPSAVYAALAPDHTPFVTQCGQIQFKEERHGSLLKMPGAAPKRKALFFEDPLCPTCKSLHERLADAGVLDRLSAELALFPLDTECNWMLDQSLHPGACQVSRALLCAKSPVEMLEWAYANQSALSEAGKSGTAAINQLLSKRWGADVLRCMSDRNTTQTLNRHLHFAVDNAIAVSTPQVFIDGQRLCDEDIDMGLMFALKRIAPELLP